MKASGSVCYWADGEVGTGVQVGGGRQVIGNGGNTGVTAGRVGVSGSAVT